MATGKQHNGGCLPAGLGLGRNLSLKRHANCYAELLPWCRRKPQASARNNGGTLVQAFDTAANDESIVARTRVAPAV